MTIKIIKGDMVKSYLNNELDAYAHQCNCFCRMGRGIAPLLAKANPNVRAADNATSVGDKNKLGTFSVAYKPNGIGCELYNIYGQYHWSKYRVAPNRNTDYEALKQGLFAVMETLHKDQYYDHEYLGVYKRKTLGLPLIGCGLAGGDWEEVVLPMIEDLFGNSGIDVTVFIL